MIWNVIKLLVAAWIIKTCVVDNDIVIGFEDTIREQFSKLFPKKNKKEEPNG